MTREVEIKVKLTLGPMAVADRNHATGVTFTGFSPNLVGQRAALALMRELRAGERVLSFDVETEVGSVGARPTSGRGAGPSP